MNNKVPNDRYVVEITSFRKITSKLGEKLFKIDFRTLMDSSSMPYSTDIVDFIKITDYDRLSELKNSFLYLSFDSLDNVIGCQGLVKVNKGYVNYYNLRDIAEAENIKIEF